MATQTIEDMTKSVAGIATNLERSATGAADLSASVNSLLDKLVPTVGNLKSLEFLLSKSVNSAKAMFQLFTHGAAPLMDELRLLQKQRQALEDLRDAGKINEKVYQEEVGLFNKHNELLGLKLQFVEKLEKTGPKIVGAAAAMATQLGLSWFNTRELNAALIEASASTAHRAALEVANYQAVIDTGYALSDCRDAQAALVKYGMDTEKGYQQTVETVVQLHKGLGLSVHTAAELAAVTERLVKGNFVAVSNVIATLVDQTSLAADEVARLGLSLEHTFGLIQPGGGKMIPQVLQALGQYESALKEVTGHAGGIEALVKKMGSAQGISQLMGLGITPEMLKSQQGVDEMMKRFGQYAEAIVGVSTGMERSMRLEAVADQLGLTSEQVNGLMLAIERKNQQSLTEITLEERAHKQVNAMNQGIELLVNRILALLQGGLYPLTFAISAITNTLADWIGELLKWKNTMYVAMVGVSIGAVYLGAKLWDMAKSAWASWGAIKLCVAGLNDLTKAALRNATVNAATGGGSVVSTAAGAAASGGGAAATVAKAVATPLSDAIKLLSSNLSAVNTTPMLKMVWVDLGKNFLNVVRVAFSTGFSMLASSLSGVLSVLTSTLLGPIAAVGLIAAAVAYAYRKNEERILKQESDAYYGRRGVTDRDNALITKAVQAGQYGTATQMFKTAINKAMSDTDKTDNERLGERARLIREQRNMSENVIRQAFGSKRFDPTLQADVAAAYEGKGKYASLTESERLGEVVNKFAAAQAVIEDKKQAGTATEEDLHDLEMLKSAKDSANWLKTVANETTKSGDTLRAQLRKTDEEAREAKRAEALRMLSRAQGSWSPVYGGY